MLLLHSNALKHYEPDKKRMLSIYHSKSGPCQGEGGTIGSSLTNYIREMESAGVVVQKVKLSHLSDLKTLLIN